MMKTVLIGLISAGVVGVFSTASAGVYQGSAAFVIKKERVAEFREAVLKIIGPTRKERGCIGYQGFQVLDRQGKGTNRFEFFEVWASKRAMMIDHKENSAHMKEFFKKVGIDSPNSMVESFRVDGKEVEEISE